MFCHRKRGISLCDKLGKDTPFLVNMMPNGPKFVMEDFHGAGGMPAVLKELQPLLHGDCLTVTGETIGQWITKAKPTWNREVIASLQKPPPHQNLWVTGGSGSAPSV